MRLSQVSRFRVDRRYPKNARLEREADALSEPHVTQEHGRTPLRSPECRLHDFRNAINRSEDKQSHIVAISYDAQQHRGLLQIDSPLTGRVA